MNLVHWGRRIEELYNYLSFAVFSSPISGGTKKDVEAIFGGVQVEEVGIGNVDHDYEDSSRWK